MMASLKTVRNWEREFKSKFDFDIVGGKVTTLRCQVCQRWESRIKNSTNFSRKWIAGSRSVTKDSVQKHTNSQQHKEAVELKKRSEMGAEVYAQSVLTTTPIGSGLRKMAASDKKNLRVKFNTAYYVAKKERPFSDYPDLLKLQLKNNVPKFGESYKHERAAATFTEHIAKVDKENLGKTLAKTRYYSLLNDGSTDTGICEQELVYVLYLHEGTALVKFLSIETPKCGDAPGILEAIDSAFQRIGILNFNQRLVGFNADGASVNMGRKKGVGALIKETAPWVEVVHCFNHRIELAIKDAFNTVKAFHDVDELLLKLYYLYQKSPKRLQGLRNFSEAFDETIPKPAKACGTRWIDHKFKAMVCALQNYGVYMTHVEELAITDSQPEKRAKLKGFLKKWKEAAIPFNMAIYLDILSPIRRLSLSMQSDEHDPVKQVRRIQEFTATMAKLKIILLDTLDGSSDIMTHHKRFTDEVINDEDGSATYQNIKLFRYDIVNSSAETKYHDLIVRLADSMEERFENLSTSTIFKNIVCLLDVSTWPTTVTPTFGEDRIDEILLDFEKLLENNGCNVGEVKKEWISLQSHIIPIVINNPREYYLKVWKRVFTNEHIRKDCENILHIIEILLCTPFTNAKVERGFSRMARVKSDFRSHLSRDMLDACLRINEDGPDICNFDPDPVIDQWYTEKVRRLGSSSHKYPKKRKSTTTTSDRVQVDDLASLALSDIDSDEDEA
ncbi:zinc finger protein 862-like [Hydractinia symbiolongicarpus]|uniref:zinc finger protein 862-like n=1 Tax=Hydractinia symbiolongicarpus TaxID=13093 RepID=UPI00254FECBD|nr:zinc finger protein 862-like [Hydractinia symbiolongicarpus]